ncbi:MAG: hypothetical protein ACRDJU_02170, partial [Actinomycetota bacterium]
NNPAPVGGTSVVEGSPTAMNKRVVVLVVVGALLALSGVTAYAMNGSPPLSSTVPSAINQAQAGVAIAGGLAKGAVNNSVSQTASDVTAVQGDVSSALGGTNAVDPALINGETNLVTTLLNSSAETLSGTIDGVTTTVSKSLDGVSETVTGTTQGVTNTITRSFNNATGVLTTVGGLTGGATSGVSQTVTNTGQLVNALAGGL